MSESDAPTNDDGKAEAVDPWVQSQLSPNHIEWMERQRSAVDPSEILKFALAEWVARHPEDWFGHTSVGIALRSALDEFIARHKMEFF